MVRSDLKFSMFQQCAVLSGAVAKYTDFPSFSELCHLASCLGLNLYYSR